MTRQCVSGHRPAPHACYLSGHLLWPLLLILTLACTCSVQFNTKSVQCQLPSCMSLVCFNTPHHVYTPAPLKKPIAYKKRTRSLQGLSNARRCCDRHLHDNPQNSCLHCPHLDFIKYSINFYIATHQDFVKPTHCMS